MFVNIITWIVIGVLAGFVISIVLPAKNKYLAGTISAGIVGAFVGGIIYSALKIGNIALTLDPKAAGLSVIGSLVLIYLVKLLVRSENPQKSY
jgi:uncharacterized membrane protein YeaQ/YmgE (transglycosylase-associated protein family)